MPYIVANICRATYHLRWCYVSFYCSDIGFCWLDREAILTIVRSTTPLFAAGIELRQISHQEWLLSNLDRRIAETGFYGLRFLKDGLRFAYLKLKGVRTGRFIKIKEGAAARYVIKLKRFISLLGVNLGLLVVLTESPRTSGQRRECFGRWKRCHCTTRTQPQHEPSKVTLIFRR